MKCIKNATTNEIKRVSDDRAVELAERDWVFVPKSEWKGAAGTKWVKNSTPDNPMSDRKKHRLSKKNAKKS